MNSILMDEDFYIKKSTLLALYNHMGINLHKNPFDDFPIIPLDCSFLGDLNTLCSLSRNEKYISFLKHNECGTDCIFTRGDYPEAFSFVTVDASCNLANDIERIFGIGIIIGEYNNI